MNKVIMCATSELLNHPSYLGLDFDVQKLRDFKWLTCFSDGNLFRQYCAQLKENAEIWVVSADNIDAINLAAAIKADRPDLPVCVIAFDMSGSLQSRAGSAHIDAVISREMFVERFMAYAEMQHYGVMQDTQGVSNSAKRILNAQQESANKGKQAFLLPIVSATGGSGKTAVAVMSAILSQLKRHKTLLIDANLQFSELTHMLKAKNIVPIDDLLATPSKIASLEPTETMPAVLAAPSKPELAESVIHELPKLIDSLRYSFEVIIIDTAGYWNELTASMLERASKALFIVDQRPSSVSATKSAIDLCTRCGIATTSFLYAVNRCKKGCLYSAVDVSCALGGVSVAEINDGKIDVDNAFMSANPLELIENKNAFALSMWNIVCSILPANSKQDGDVDVIEGVNRHKNSKQSKKRKSYRRKKEEKKLAMVS